jgi:opacity protein-like surface antigen
MRIPLLLSLVLAVAVGVDDASAQGPRPGRPYRGLFGGGVGDFTQLLTVNGSVGTGWDNNLLADALGRETGVVNDLNSSHRGGLGTASASLNYSLNKERVSARASAGNTTRYYPSLGSDFVNRQYLFSGGSWNIGKGLAVGASASYQPYSLGALYPGLIDPRTGDEIVDEDFASSSQHYAAYSGVMSFEHRLSRRTTFSIDGTYHIRDSSFQGLRTVRSAGAGISRSLTRDLSLRLGYRYYDAEYDGYGGRAANHVIDVGIDYAHALSISRRTQISFSTGTSADRSAVTNQMRYRAIGSADLTHEIGRTWFASLGYSRGVRFIDSWPEPVFYDGATAQLSGLVTRRLQVFASLRAAFGKQEVFADSSRFHTYYGNTGLSYALSRFINAGVTYAYYQHRFPNSFVLAPGYPSHVSRETVRVYISAWAPLFRRTGRP